MLACRNPGLFLFAYGEAATVNNRGAIMNLSAGRKTNGEAATVNNRGAIMNLSAGRKTYGEAATKPAY